VKIREVEVHNYRSFKDSSFHLADYGLLIGANNAGKSNALDLLRTFYEKDLKFDHARDFPKFPTEDEESWVEVEYELTPDEAAQIKSEYLQDGKTFRVRRIIFSRDRSRLHLYAYEAGRLSGNQFYGDDNVGKGKLGEILYIPAITRLEDVVKFSGPSPLRDLVTDIIKKLVKSSAAFSALQEAIDSFGTIVQSEETPDHRSLAGLQDDINRRLQGWKTRFRLRFNSLSETDVVKSILDCDVIDETLEKELAAGGCGHGFQRHLIYTLLTVAAEYAPTKAPPKKKEFAPELNLLLFEEPENFLHPPQQAQLDRSLRTLGTKPGQQVLVATHSPVFVSQSAADLSGIVRLSRAGAQSIVGQVRPGRLDSLFIDNQQINALAEGLRKYAPSADERLLEMEAAKYFLWLNPSRCGVFFAKRAILVEGPTETALINYLIQTGQIALDEDGAFALDCMGKFNIHRFMNLLGELRVEHCVLHDSDATAGNEQEQAFHKGVNELIQTATNDSTRCIKVLEEDLETFLQYTSDGPSHRKPARLLLALQKGAIESDRIAAFCRLVEEITTSSSRERREGGPEVSAP